MDVGDRLRRRIGPIIGDKWRRPLDEIDNELGRGVVALYGGIDVFEGGLRLPGKTGAVRFSSITDWRCLLLPELMTANKDHDTPVDWWVIADEVRHGLPVHLYTYTSLASVLPYALRGT